MVGTVIAGRFHLEHKAGSGGMGAVFRARDLSKGGTVAVKLLASQEVRDEQRFAQEASILAGLSHPAIVRYIEHGSAAGCHFLVMEWLEGEDLQGRIEREPLGIRDTLAMLRRCAEALTHAHDHGVIHRDIKPQNLFLADGKLDRLKILDFGIARLAHNAARITRTGTLVGTPGYLAPEIIQGSRVIDGRADVFALGCVAFECLTGRPAFEGNDASVLLAKIVLEDAPNVRDYAPHVGDEVGAVIAQMMLKDVSRRYDAAALLTALNKLSQAPGDQTTAPKGRKTAGRLTIGEQRIGCIVMAGSPPGTQDPLPEDAAGITSLLIPAAGPPRELQIELINAFGVTIYPLIDGSFIVTLPSGNRTTDQPTLAARCALVLRERLPNVAVVVASGPGHFEGGNARGPVVDVAVRLLRTTPRGNVRLDPTAASILGSRFEVHRDDGAVFLRREREVYEAKRNLLGKPSLFAGRGQELSMLAAILNDASSEGTAHAVLLKGAPGIGKSRLLHEFLDWVHKREEPTAVFFGVGDSLAAGAPFAMLAQAIRRYAEIKDADPLEERQRKLETCVARTVPPESRKSVTVFLGEIVGTPFPDSEHDALRAARQNPQLMADATRRAFEDWLKAECRVHSVVFILEDLHWGDSGTVNFIDSALRNLRNEPFVVVALARPELAGAFPDLWKDRHLRSIELAPLSRKAGEKIVREALGPGVQDDMVTDLLTRADGNPFFLEELIRATHEGRFETLPPSVLGIVQARLDADGAEAKRVLRAASVFGDHFTARGLAALLGGDEERPVIADWLERLTERELITRAPFSGRTDEPEFSFGHSLIREAAYSMLTDEDLVLGHRLAGEFLEDSGYAEAMVLAEHYRRGADPASAAPWYNQGASQALKANDLTGAIARAELGLDSLAQAEKAAAEQDIVLVRPPRESPTETRGGIFLTLTEARLWRGEGAAAEEPGRAAMGLLRAGSPEWFRATAQTIIALGKQGKAEQLEELLGDVRKVAHEPASRDAQVICLGWAASYLVVAGRYAATESALVDAVALAVPFRDVGPEALALIHQAQVARALVSGDLTGCLENLESALAAFVQAGDVRNACSVRSNMGFFYGEVGELERAEEALREALAAADRLGLPEMVAVVQHNLGRIVGWRGDLREAERFETIAIESFKTQREPRLEGIARVYLADILIASGRLDDAEREACAAAELLSSAPSAHVLAVATAARARLSALHPAEALKTSQEAFDELEKLGAIEEGEAIVRLVHAEALAANGQMPKAREVLHKAHERLAGQAARLSGVPWRDRFWSKVPAHARVLALAEQWGLVAPDPDRTGADAPKATRRPTVETQI